LTAFGRSVCGVLLAALWVAPGATAASDLETFRVTRPDVLLFDRASREQTLAAIPQIERERLCGAGMRQWPKHGVVRNVYNGKQPGQNVVLTLMTAAAAAFGTDDEAARAAVVDNLARWAEGDALGQFKQNPAATMYYNLDRTLLPVIVSFSLVRDHPAVAASDRQRIEKWLDRLVWRRGPGRERNPDLTSSRNNHRYLSDSVTMAWGILRGDDNGFRAGIERYLAALEQMRPDGSLPLETARGARALSYQRHAIASLVAIAEMAAAQGYDLYAIEGTEGQSIHRAIEFLLDGIDDPAIVWRYAMENEKPGAWRNYRVQDLGFMTVRGHGRHYMAWTEPYLARFPESELALRLRRSLDEFGADKPMIDEYSGGSMSCFFALPDAIDEPS
jgi:poly(beta-D-mannuronate) lyase